jgi:hypothetical protein
MPVACQIESLLFVFPKNKKEEVRKKDASRNTHTPRKKQNKQSTKSKRQREAAEACTLVLCCCRALATAEAATCLLLGAWKKSKRKIFIIRAFQLPTKIISYSFIELKIHGQRLLAILHMPNFFCAFCNSVLMGQACSLATQFSACGKQPDL